MRRKILCADEEYFRLIETYVERAYRIAQEARKKGYDPERFVEVGIAKDLAKRTEELVGPPGIAKTISEHKDKLSREELIKKVVDEILEGKYGSFSREKLAEQAIRTALAIATESIVAAPIEGITQVRIKRNPDGTEYLAIYFAGPIRSAGGTAQTLSVIVGDYVRRKLGLDRYKPTKEEIERYLEELRLYPKNFQIKPSEEDFRLIVENCPVEITGEGAGLGTVGVYTDLDRVETNEIREGALLVIVEGFIQKASKVGKLVKKFDLDGWEFIEKLSTFKGVSETLEEEENEEEVREESEEEASELEADDTYARDVVGGRAILSDPLAPGGFRIRYGKSFNTGLATGGFNPALMIVLDEAFSIGSQLKVERPGKARAVAPVTSIEGPFVKLADGSCLRINTIEKARELKNSIVEIIELGEMLVGYGEFLKSGHPLVPAGYCPEWWVQELMEADRERKYEKFYDPEKVPTYEEAKKISLELGIPLHPSYTFFYREVSAEDILVLGRFLSRGSWTLEGLEITLEDNETCRRAKRTLEILCVEHYVKDNKIVIPLELARALVDTLGMGESLDRSKLEKFSSEISENGLELVRRLAPFEIRDRVGTRIGARVAKPEKSKERKMRPPVHVLYPVGDLGGPTRDILKAAERSPTIRRELDIAMRRLNARGGELSIGASRINRLKGVKGLTSRDKIPERLEKGILRAKYDIYVYKDGTVRFDANNLALIAFRPRDINTPVEKLKELGYTEDIFGNPLERDDQIVPLKIQDIVIPKNALEYLFRVAKFVDEELEKIYGMKPFYNLSKPEDLIGHLVIGLAPHTSAGVVGRIIGYADIKACYAHPFFHAAKRRNCDGDEDSLILLMDALLNFSRRFLPDKRGGKMDAPLVITTRIDPREIDDEAHAIDVMAVYPREFYEATQRLSDPEEVRSFMKVVGDFLGTSDQYMFVGFTHPTDSIVAGVRESKYTKLKSMEEKVKFQLSLARKLRPVNELRAADRILESHFLRDIVGNLRSFQKQEFRCTRCGSKYRRIPLSGKCLRCGNPLKLTVARGMVLKYIDIVRMILESFGASEYNRERIKVILEELKETFEMEESTAKLTKFMGIETS